MKSCSIPTCPTPPLAGRSGGATRNSNGYNPVTELSVLSFDLCFTRGTLHLEIIKMPLPSHLTPPLSLSHFSLSSHRLILSPFLSSFFFLSLSLHAVLCEEEDSTKQINNLTNKAKQRRTRCQVLSSCVAVSCTALCQLSVTAV